MERLLALYDSDVFYSTRFMDYLKKKKDFPFEVSIFTKKESLVEYLTFHRIEILLIGDLDTLEDIPCEKAKFIYQLTDHPGKSKELKYPEIFKYQEVQGVISEVVKDYSKKVKIIDHGKVEGQVQIFSILSLIPCIEAHAFTWAFSSIFAEEHNTLLVYLDPMPVTFLSTIDNENSMLSEFIYYLKGNPDIITKMKASLQQAGSLSYLFGTVHATDIFSLNSSDMTKWVEELRKASDYQIVVFYLGGYTEASIELMNLSDTVLLAGMETTYEKYLLKTWAKQMELSGIDTKLEKFMNLRLQEEKELKQLPVSLSDLARTFTWNNACKSIEFIKNMGA